MKHLVGKTISMSIMETGILYNIEVDKEFTVEIVNCGPSDYEMIICPTGVDNALIVETTSYDTLFDAIKNADEIIEELKTPEVDALGPQEPPNNSMIFNRKQPDGTYRPVSEFFDKAIEIAERDQPQYKPRLTKVQRDVLRYAARGSKVYGGWSGVCQQRTIDALERKGYLYRDILRDCWFATDAGRAAASTVGA